jgi:hypothetical protein
MSQIKGSLIFSILFLIAIVSNAQQQETYKDMVAKVYKLSPIRIKEYLKDFVEKDDTATVNKLTAIATLYKWYKPDSVQIYALKSLAISKRINYDYGIIYSYQILLVNNKANGDFPAALKYANAQLRYVQEINDTTSIIDAYKEIANLWYKTKNFRYAIETSNKGLEFINSYKEWSLNANLDKTIGKNEIQAFSSILGNSYNSLLMKDSALFYFNRALEATSGLGSDFDWNKSDAFFDLANFSYHNKDYDIAVGYLNKNTLFDEPKNYEEVRNLLFLKIFIANKKVDSAMKYLKLLSTYQHSANKSELNEEIDRVETFINYYKLINNKDSILKYQSIFLSLKDSAYNQDEIKRLEAIRIAESVKDFELQEKQKQEEKKRSNNIKLGAISIFIPTFTAIVFYLGRRKSKNTKIFTLLGLASLLMLFEFISLLIHPYVEHLTNHDTILMYLILLIIASILVPIHHKLESWVKEKI